MHLYEKHMLLHFFIIYCTLFFDLLLLMLNEFLKLSIKHMFGFFSIIMPYIKLLNSEIRNKGYPINVEHTKCYAFLFT